MVKYIFSNTKYSFATSKVDRSAAYAARWIAKSIVHSHLARRVLVQLSYAIGVARPLSVYVDTYGTGVKSDSEILAIIDRVSCIQLDIEVVWISLFFFFFSSEL